MRLSIEMLQDAGFTVEVDNGVIEILPNGGGVTDRLGDVVHSIQDLGLDALTTEDMVHGLYGKYHKALILKCDIEL